MHSRKRLRVFVIAMLAAAVTLLAPVAPAYADVTTPFEVRHPTFPNTSYTEGGADGVPGGIVWHNRTATVSGVVVDIGSGNTTAYFRAYAGTTQIGGEQSRTANDESSLGQVRGFSFVMGDTNLRGGINRIRIQVCWNGFDCGSWKDHLRP